MQMFTDPGHIHVNDPGKVEGNVVFTYVDVFDPDKKEVEALKEHYRKGGLGDIKIKKRLIEKMTALLHPIRERRNEHAKDKSALERILKEGSAKARDAANQTLKEVRAAIGINFWD